MPDAHPIACVVAGQVTNVVRSCLQSSLALKQAGTSCRDAIGWSLFKRGHQFNVVNVQANLPKKTAEIHLGGWMIMTHYDVDPDIYVF